MRRNERQVTSLPQIKEIIKNCRVCRIAVNDGPAPYIVPMSFGYKLRADGELTLYFHCAGAGKKNTLLKENLSVGFEMDRMLHITGRDKLACSYTCLYESIVGTGTAAFLTSPDSKRDALLAIMEHQTGQSGFALDSRAADKTAVFCIISRNFTAKQNKE